MHVYVCFCVFLSFYPHQMVNFCLQIYMRCFLLSWISRSVIHFHCFASVLPIERLFSAKRPVNDCFKQDLPRMSHSTGVYCRCVHEWSLMEIIIIEKENKGFTVTENTAVFYISRFSKVRFNRNGNEVVWELTRTNYQKFYFCYLMLYCSFIVYYQCYSFERKRNLDFLSSRNSHGRVKFVVVFLFPKQLFNLTVFWFGNS